MPTFEIESSLPFSFIAGCDEAGRGPLCGPVVAAAVIFLPAPLAGRDRVAYEQSELATLGWGKKSDDPTQDSLGLAQALVKPNLSRPASGAGFPININDSKKMTHAGREAAYEFLTNNPDIIWAVAQCSPSEIDEFNILAASMIAMERAIAKLNIRPEFALIDGNRLPNMICPPTGSPVALRAPGLADSPQGGSNPSSATTPPLG